jgi:hypothetical protein
MDTEMDGTFLASVLPLNIRPLAYIAQEARMSNAQPAGVFNFKLIFEIPKGFERRMIAIGKTISFYGVAT